MLDGEGEADVFYVADARGFEELRQVALARSGQARLACDVGLELARSLPEEAQRPPAAGCVVPDARRDDAVVSRDASHLREPGHGVRHEVHDELCERRVEGIVCEGQFLGRSLPHLDVGVALPSRGHERLGRVDCRHGGRPHAVDQLGDESAGAAADVEHALAGLGSREVREERCQVHGVPAHEPVVGVRGDCEAHAPNLLARRNRETPGMGGTSDVERLDALAAERSFSGVVRVDRGGRVELASAYGHADRAQGLPNELDTRCAIASGTKGLTALAVMTLVEDGTLALETTARSLLGSDLPEIADDVTIEHLLSHRSGIGDYVDEESGVDVRDYLLPLPVSELTTTEQYLAVLEGHPAKFAPGGRFAYCNSGYVVLALVAERAAGLPFHELVVERVCDRAGLTDTAFLCSDELPERTAHGYLDAEGLRTNVFHLPVRGSGDGGIYSTAADIRALWTAFFAGEIVAPASVAEMVRPRSDVPAEKKRYGLGFWLHESSDAAILEGYDAGVSFRSIHDRGRDLTITVISNWTDGAWPVARQLAELFDT